MTHLLQLWRISSAPKISTSVYFSRFRSSTCRKRSSSGISPSITLWKDIADKAGVLSVSEIEFDEVMKSLRLEAPVAVAVSGGSDSMALSHLALEWTRKTSPSSPLYAFTVDHRFRSESAAEADLVHQWLDAHIISKSQKVQHRTLAIDWKGESPSPGQKQSRGREERLKLLTEECEKLKCKYLLTAHQREDQLDTFLMRLGRQSGNNGLGGIQSVSSIGGIQLVRPLLSFSRDRLKATCKRFKQSYINDPSNDSDQYLRTRVRSIRQSIVPGKVPPEEIESLMSFLRESTADLNRSVDLAIRQICHSDSTLGYTKVPLKALRELPDVILYHLVERLVVCYTPQTDSSSRYSVPHRPLQRLVNLLKTKKSEVVRDGWGVTIGTCYIFRNDDLRASKPKSGSKRNDVVTWMTFSQSHEDKRAPIPTPIQSGTPLRWRGWHVSFESQNVPKAFVSVCSPSIWPGLLKSDERLRAAKASVHPVLRQSLPVIHVDPDSTGNVKFLALPAVGLQAKNVSRATAEYAPQWPTSADAAEDQ